MPILIEWADDEHTLLVAKATSHFTWDDYRRAAEQVHEMASSVSHTVDGIADVSESRLPPGNPFPFMKYFASRIPPNIGVFVQVGATGFECVVASTFVSIYRHLGGRKLFIVKTMEEAEAIIAQQKTALPVP